MIQSKKVQHSFLIFFSSILAITSCQKKPFFGDNCTGECYVLSGYVWDDSTALPIKNVLVNLKVPKGVFTKNLIEVYSDDSGYWKMSFDANYIENLETGVLEYSRSSYLGEKQAIEFDESEINFEKTYTSAIHKAAKIEFAINLSNESVKRIQARYTFEGEEYTISRATSADKPFIAYLPHSVPAYEDVSVSLWYSKSGNQGNNSSWVQFSSPVNINLAFEQTDTIYVDL